MLNLAAEAFLIVSIDIEREYRRELVMLAGIPALVRKGGEQNRIRQKGVPQADAIGVCLGFFFKAWIKIVREKTQVEIAVFDISISILPLNAGTGREFHLQEGVADSILLEVVFSKPIRIKVEAAKAEGSIFVDAGDDPFSGIGIVFAA